MNRVKQIISFLSEAYKDPRKNKLKKNYKNSNKNRKSAEEIFLAAKRKRYATLKVKKIKTELVPLETLSNQEEVSQVIRRPGDWGGLSYKGIPLLENYLKALEYFSKEAEDVKFAEWTEEVCEEGDDGEEYCYPEEIRKELQESYLGYLPDKDIFIVGYDMWEGEDNPAGLIEFKILGSNSFSIIKEDIDYRSIMMYGKNGAYKKLHAKYPNLIDIRLD